MAQKEFSGFSGSQAGDWSGNQVLWKRLYDYLFSFLLGEEISKVFYGLWHRCWSKFFISPEARIWTNGFKLQGAGEILNIWRTSWQYQLFGSGTECLGSWWNIFCCKFLSSFWLATSLRFYNDRFPASADDLWCLFQLYYFKSKSAAKSYQAISCVSKCS